MQCFPDIFICLFLLIFLFISCLFILICVAVRGCIGRYLPYQTNPQLSTSTLPHPTYQPVPPLFTFPGKYILHSFYIHFTFRGKYFLLKICNWKHLHFAPQALLSLPPRLPAFYIPWEMFIYRSLGCGPLGLLDNVLHALRALRPCDPRNSAMMG